MPSPIKKATFTIASSGTISDAKALYGAILAIVMPAAWDDANLTFQFAAVDSTTFQPLLDENGALITFTEPAGKFDGQSIRFKPAEFYIGGALKLVSTATQTAERVIEVVYRPFD